MNESYAFTFDARFCSGCKACQAACKDKNALPTGVLWRRVVEVAGGSWQENGAAWNNSVFAYHLSISCNHCLHPKCAGVCPTDAYTLREDGIVVLDPQKCVGCGYCAWACPYGAPQYDVQAGCMTKCDFCVDHLEQGLPPACVAACPMRVLDYGEMTSRTGLRLWDLPPETHPDPLPAYSHTQPRLAIVPHPAMNTSEKKIVANLEEIQPRRPTGWEELPLVIFTLLIQMAVGGFWMMNWMFSALWLLVESDATRLHWLPSAWIGASLGIGMLVSFAHLGRKKNAWRVLRHWRKSSLSKEILFLGLFGLAWLFATLDLIYWHSAISEWRGITAILGIGLIYNMAQIYRIPAVPGWNSWRTNVNFMLSALLLGISAMTLLLVQESRMTGIQIFYGQRILLSSSILVLLLVQWLLLRRPTVLTTLHSIRIGLILLGCILAAIPIFFVSVEIGWLSSLLFLIVAGEEGLGRWLFYRSRLEP